MVLMRRSVVKSMQISHEKTRRHAREISRAEQQAPIGAASHVATLDDLPGPAPGLDPTWDSLGLPTEAYVYPYSVKVGSICSGMCTESWAFPHLPWKFQKAFWCENALAPRAFLLRNFGDVPNWRDCMSAEFQNEAPGCDVLLSGFPWRRIRGIRKAHEIVILSILQYIR